MSQTKDRQRKILKKFIKVYCRAHHGSWDKTLCDECSKLYDYASSRLEKCPYDPKPKCKDCRTHCYKLEYREQIKSVMRFSGIYFIKRGRFDWLIRYFLN